MVILHIFCIYKIRDNYLGIINKNTGERSMNYFIIIDAVTLILGNLHNICVTANEEKRQN